MLRHFLPQRPANRALLSRPAALGRIGARVVEDQFVQVSVEGDRPMEGKEREETAIVFPFFRSVAKFKVDAMARVLDVQSFEPHRLETDLDRGHKTDRIGTDGAFGGRLA